MAAGKGISLFLIDGAPDGRIACELLNWTGKCYKIPRTLLKQSANREDLNKAGVYFLFGRDESSAEMSLAYIGEAEEVYKRLAQHQSEEFWNEILVFISKDENLNKAHVKFLEYEIFTAAKEVDRYTLTNSNTPTRPAISELEQAVITEFFENLRLLVGTMGYKIFEPLTKPAPTEPGIVVVSEYSITAARGANARARFTSEGMVVLKGSEIATSLVPSTPDTYIKLREKLIEQGVVVEQADKLVFQKDHLFSTPSSAAAAVMGRSANGLIEWKDAKGRTLKQNEEH